jgi:SAM-dependent methyltransferase
MVAAMNELRPRAESGNTQLCPQCGSVGALFRSSGDINNATTNEIFYYYRCSGCDLIFMADIPADMAPFYRRGYQAIPADLRALRKLAARERYRLQELVKLKNQGRLLEIGPWIGIFSINAKDAGFEVDAIESDATCVDFLVKVAGITVFQSNDPATELAELPHRYDAVVLWHSLEHLPTPWRVIEQAAAALKPGGVLLIAIPNIDSYESQAMRENWVHLDAPRHLYFYAPAALTSLCRQFGLAPLHVSTTDRLSFMLGLQAWYRYLRRCRPFAYLRALCGLRHRPGSGLTAIFQKS